MTANDSIINKAKMISDLYFSHHILEALCYCYKCIKCRYDYMLGRTDKRRILEQGDAGLCLLVNICWVHNSLTSRQRSPGELRETESGMS